MRWIWDNLLKPVFQWAAEKIVDVFAWVWKFPIKGITAGLTCVAAGWLLGIFGAEKAETIIVNFGWAMVTTGVTSHIVDWFAGWLEPVKEGMESWGEAIWRLSEEGWPSLDIL